MPFTILGSFSPLLTQYIIIDLTVAAYTPHGSSYELNIRPLSPGSELWKTGKSVSLFLSFTQILPGDTLLANTL